MLCGKGALPPSVPLAEPGLGRGSSRPRLAAHRLGGQSLTGCVGQRDEPGAWEPKDHVADWWQGGWVGVLVGLRIRSFRSMFQAYMVGTCWYKPGTGGL